MFAAITGGTVLFLCCICRLLFRRHKKRKAKEASALFGRQVLKFKPQPSQSDENEEEEDELELELLEGVEGGRTKGSTSGVKYERTGNESGEETEGERE